MTKILQSAAVKKCQRPFLRCLGGLTTSKSTLKSLEILNISASQSTVQRLKHTIPLLWPENSIRVLGTQIPTKQDHFISLKYILRLTNFSTQISKMQSPLPPGCRTILNTYILPNYQNLFFRSLQPFHFLSMARWASKAWRQGRFALLDLYSYYQPFSSLI